MPPRQTTATPRNTRARQRTPLPAVPSAPSFAYGAPGKAELRTQVRASGRDFGEGFEAARQASAEPESVAEAEEEEEIDASSVVAPSEAMERNLRSNRRAPSAPVEKYAPRRTPPAAARRQAEPEPEPRIEAATARAEAERVATDLDAGARYQQAQREEVAERVEPSKSRVFRRAFPRYIHALFAPADSGVKESIAVWFVTLLAILGFFTILAHVPLPEKLAEKRNDNIHAFKRVLRLDPWSVPPTFLQENWYRFQHDRIFSADLPDYNVPELQYVVNLGLLKRLEKVEAKVADLEDGMRLHNETLAHIKKMLPSHLVVQYVDGRYEIPEVFWDALRERLLTQSDMSPLWQAFISRSESQVEEIFAETVDTKLDRAIQENQIITASRFGQLMNEKYEELSNKYQNELRDIQTNHLGEVKEIAAGAASDVVKQYPSAQFIQTQLQKLNMMTELHNVYSKISETNWFSIGAGARVDPGTTSKTNPPDSPGLIQSFLRKISPLHVSKYPATMALKPWQEPTDCWCASHEDYGYAQIGITLKQKIYPEKFTIEHIPATGTQDVKSAPREFEVWADIGDVNTASHLARDNEQNRLFEWQHPCGEPPGPSMVCLISHSYDIHAHNWVQSHWLFDGEPGFQQAHDAGIRSSKFIVRITSNYGANYTCLYRLRMTGELVEFAVSPA